MTTVDLARRRLITRWLAHRLGTNDVHVESEFAVMASPDLSDVASSVTITATFDLDLDSANAMLDEATRLVRASTASTATEPTTKED